MKLVWARFVDWAWTMGSSVLDSQYSQSPLGRRTFCLSGYDRSNPSGSVPDDVERLCYVYAFPLLRSCLSLGECSSSHGDVPLPRGTGLHFACGVILTLTLSKTQRFLHAVGCSTTPGSLFLLSGPPCRHSITVFSASTTSRPSTYFPW